MASKTSVQQATPLYSPPTASSYIVGIDLGTTTCSCSIYRDGSVEPIESSTGQYTTPSIVAFTPTELLVGAPANEQKNTANSANFLYGIKRLIGRNYNDPEIKQDLDLWGFQVVEDPSTANRPLIKVEFLGETKFFSPEEISAFILVRLRKELSARLGRDVSHCVITVPAYFGDAQRSATRNAGIIAGWNVVRIINEPTAAAFYNALRHISHQLATGAKEFNRNLLIFDLGGGTYDVSILNLQHKSDKTVVSTLSSGGDSHFGGEDFDNAVIRHFYDMINSDVSKQESIAKWDLRLHNPGRAGQRKYAKLRSECVRAKEDLAVAQSTPINLNDIESKCDIVAELTRADFDKLIKPLLDRISPPLQQALDDAKLAPSDIDDVVLVGGSSRIIAVRDILKKIFGEDKLKEIGAEADTAVSRGAAVVAAMSSINKQQELTFTMDLVDITSHSLSRLAGGTLHSIIPKNSPIPFVHKFTVTKRQGPSSLSLVLYEGESKKIRENVKLGTIRIENLNEDHENDFECTISVDENNIIAVEMYDPITQQKQVAHYEKGDLNDSQILIKRQQFVAIDDEIQSLKKINYQKDVLADKIKDITNILSKFDIELVSSDKTQAAHLELFEKVRTSSESFNIKKPTLAEVDAAIDDVNKLAGFIDYIKSLVPESPASNAGGDDDDDDFDFDF